jgi:hypothetical protein
MVLQRKLRCGLSAHHLHMLRQQVHQLIRLIELGSFVELLFVNLPSDVRILM